MLTLFTYGSYFGLPDGSPFCTKGLMLMRMSGLRHEVAKMSFKQAPKGKAPYLRDGDTLIADSFFIQRHLEEAHGIDFSGGYEPARRGVGFALSRMLEEHFYFLVLRLRWLDDENFRAGPAQFFNDVPAPLRPLVRSMVRGKQKKALHLQGLGRHTVAEMNQLAAADMQAVEDVLGDNPYILGPRPSAADAVVLPFLWSATPPQFKGGLVDNMRGRPRLMAYVRRLQEQFFPEFPVQG